MLVARRVKGALLVGIVATTVVAIIANALGGGDVWGDTGVAKVPTDIIALPDFSLVGAFSFNYFFELGVLAALLAVGIARKSRKLMRIAGIWAAFYLAIGAVQHQRAESITAHWAEERGFAAERVLAKPSFANLVLWRGLVDDGENLHALAVRILPGSEALVWPGSSVARYEPEGIPADSRLGRDLERFRHFSSDWLFRYFRYDEDDEIFVGDFRYAIDPASQRPLWGILFDPEEPGRSADFIRPARVTEDEREAFFDRLAGRDPPP